MAIYHLSASVVSRSKGMSSVAKSAYNSCDKMTNEYDGTIHNYSNKPQHTYHEILLPENAPKEYQDKSKLWNAVELSEKNKNAQLCRSFDIALPKELSREEQEKLIHDYCKENFSDKGMCVQIDIHSNPENPHAHVMTTLREIDENGKWKAKQYKEYLCTNGKEKEYFRPEQIPDGYEKVIGKNGKPKTRAVNINNWNEKDTLLEWRKNWSEKCNEKLEEKGIEKKITHLSHKDRELYVKPQIHLGSYNHALMKQGKSNERIEEYKNIIELNKRIREIRKAFIEYVKSLKGTPAKHERAEMLLLAKQNEERAKMSVDDLKFKIENNLLTIDRKKEELKALEGKWFKGKEKAELQGQIDKLKEENYRLSETLKEKKNTLTMMEQNRKREERSGSAAKVDRDILDRINRQYERPQVQSVQTEQQRQEQIKRMQEFDKQFNSLGIKAKPKENNDMLKPKDKAKPIVKEFSGNKKHDMGNPLEKSNKAKAKDEHTRKR